MTILHIRWTGLDELRAELAKKSAVRDFRVPLKRCAVSFYHSVQARFDSQTSPANSPWPPLSPKYAARAVKQAHQRLLVVSGLLSHSILTSEGGPGGLGTTTRLTENELHAGTALPYAAVHNFGAYHQTVQYTNRFGTQIERRMGIPRREFLGFTTEDEEIFEDIFADWFVREGAPKATEN